MSSSKKATIYLDSDDDITAVINAVKTAKEQIVALVVPKRAEVFSSMVNIKLLKRASKQAKKQVVLITDNPSITKIAAAVEVYVAASLRSKPAIPVKVASAPDKNKPLEELEKESLKTTDDSGAETLKKPTSKPKGNKKSKTKGFKVPNFDAFRIKLVLAVLAVLMLPALWFVGFKVLPNASIKITTNATNLPVNLDLAATLDQNGIDVEQGVVPVSVEENKQQITEDFTATGEKQIGEKASGLVTISNCTDDPVSIASGTGFSSGNLTFISQSTVNLESGNFTGGGVCKSIGGHIKTVSVTAEQPGDQYNLSSRSYNIAGTSGDVTALGNDMSGGVDEIVTVVSQQDIDSALQRLEAKKETDPVKAQLVSTLEAAGLIPIPDTFGFTQSEPTSTAEVDEESAGGSVSVSVTYTMVGVRETDILEFALPSLELQAGDLQVIDSGIAAARYSGTKQDSGAYKITVNATGVAGLVLDADAVYDEIAGRPADEAAAQLRSREGITQVEISTSPFWISSVPENKDKVNIEINGSR